MFDELRNENLEAKQRAQAEKELKECSFRPDTHRSKRPGEEMVPPRDLYGFLSDQQRFLETKNMKMMKMKQETMEGENTEITAQPKLDGLSVQIADMLDDRKGSPTHKRLYNKG